ncbi:hypothetical protein [Streptomyces sp. LN704]|uniref:hypothetical protein n=1 Tax=unclassified Streptomyces TaxID=2593676 RepID=UPI00371A8D0A
MGTIELLLAAVSVLLTRADAVATAATHCGSDSIGGTLVRRSVVRTAVERPPRS